jgi:methionyl-tRNA formyltransferase
VKDHVDDASSETRPGCIDTDGRVTCASGLIEVLELQVPGGRAVTLDEFKCGNPWTAGGLLLPWVMDE